MTYDIAELISSVLMKPHPNLKTKNVQLENEINETNC